MKTNIWKSLGLMALLTVLVTGTAKAADPDGSNNSDMIRVRITPNADYGVQIDTGNLNDVAGGVIDMGAMTLGQSTWTVRPATVTILGTVSFRTGTSGQELNVTVDLEGTEWLVDTTPQINGLGPVDELSTFVLFSATTLSAAPAASEFLASGGVVSESAIRAGDSTGDTDTTYEQTGGGATDMNNLSVTNAKHMWLYFGLPSATSTGNAQHLTVTLTAVPAS